MLFHLGDSGNALSISLQGEIGLRIAGSTRCLASFEPNITIGEMAEHPTLANKLLSRW